MFSSPFLSLPTGLEIAEVNLREDLLIVSSGGFDEGTIVLFALFLLCRTLPKPVYRSIGKYVPDTRTLLRLALVVSKAVYYDHN